MQSGNSKNQNMDIDELKFSDLLWVIKRYKYSIISIALLVTFISVAMAYYKPNTYKAQATIEISRNAKSTAIQDMIQAALMGTTTSDIDTEKAILKSRLLILDAMKQVDVVTHIWSVNRIYKKHELYLDSPIAIDIIKGRDIKFKLSPINKDFYRLEFDGRKSDGSKFHYKGRYKYNKQAKSKYFDLVITKTGLPLSSKYYEFIIFNTDHYAEMLRHLKINVTQLEEKANILGITYQDSVALRAKEFVNTLASVYMKKNIEHKTKEATQTLKFINKQLSAIEDELKKSENNIEKFKIKQKTVDIKMSANQISKTLADYENKVGILNMQISILNTAYNKVKKGVGLDTLTLVGVGIDTSGVSSLINELQQALIKRKTLLKEYTSAHPEVQKVTARIENLKRIIKKSVSNILKELRVKKDLLTKQMNKYQTKLKKLPKAQQNYLSLERKFTFNSKFYNYLLEKRTETEIKKAATVSQNRIVDLAILPEKSNKRSLFITALLGFIEGVILGTLVAFLRNFFNNTIKTIGDVKRGTIAPVIASIPKFYLVKNRGLIVKEEPKSPEAESFRILRTNLQFMVEDKSSKVIAVTSTVPKEGKTTIIGNLGVTLEMLDKRVVILNLDLRKPTLHKMFNMDNNIGLSEYLSGQTNLDKILKFTEFDNLHIIPAGKVPPNPSELISSDRLKELIDNLKEYYDYILIDTPPIGIITDAKIALKLVDVVLYIVRANYSKKEFLQTVNELYKDEKIPSLGVILNAIKDKAGYGYGYYYE